MSEHPNISDQLAQMQSGLQNIRESMERREAITSARLDTLSTQIDNHRTQVDKRYDELLHLSHNQALASEKLSLQMSALVEYNTSSVKPTVAFISQMRNRGVGLLFAVGIAGSSVSYYLWSHWAKFMKLLSSL